MKKSYDATIEATAATLIDATVEGIIEVPTTDAEWDLAIEMSYEVALDGDLDLREIFMNRFDKITIRACAERMAKDLF